VSPCPGYRSLAIRTGIIEPHPETSRISTLVIKWESFQKRAGFQPSDETNKKKRKNSHICKVLMLASFLMLVLGVLR